jgi:hypothetical protein
MTGPLGFDLEAQIAAFSPRLQALLGYEIRPLFMGNVTAHPPRRTLEPGWTPSVARA